MDVNGQRLQDTDQALLNSSVLREIVKFAKKDVLGSAKHIHPLQEAEQKLAKQIKKNSDRSKFNL